MLQVYYFFINTILYSLSYIENIQIKMVVANIRNLLSVLPFQLYIRKMQL